MAKRIVTEHSYVSDDVPLVDGSAEQTEEIPSVTHQTNKKTTSDEEKLSPPDENQPETGVEPQISDDLHENCLQISNLLKKGAEINIICACGETFQIKTKSDYESHARWCDAATMFYGAVTGLDTLKSQI